MKQAHVAVAIALSGSMLAAVAAAGAPRPQEPIPPPQQGIAPHEAIAQLDLEVVRLTAQGVLTFGQGTSLTTKLDQASSALMVGEPGAVLRPLNAFDHEVDALVGAQIIGGKDSILLQGLTEQAIVGVEAVSNLPLVLPAITPCPVPEACDALVVHVDDSASPGGDGSEDAPLQTLAAALAAAAKAQACGVKIVLHAGTYRESVTLTRPTRIEDAGRDRPVIVGSLLNPTGHRLSVSGVTFEGSPAPGAIVVDGPCGSSTEISNVVIRNAREHGVFQRRGALRIVGTEIRGTVADPSDADTGRAIRLLDGAQAVIGFANLSFNGGGALLAGGEDTRVYLALSSVDSNDLHPLLAATPSTHGTGILEATDGAIVLSEFTSLIGNRGTGMLAGNGARAHFRYGRIERTDNVAIEGEGNYYGINALALDGGTLQLSHFRSHHAAFIGLYFLRGYGRASHGTVGYNPIAMAALELPSDFSVNELFACLDEVSFLHNDRNFDGDTFPLPCEEDCPACTVSVPFICTWCG